MINFLKWSGIVIGILITIGLINTDRSATTETTSATPNLVPNTDTVVDQSDQGAISGVATGTTVSEEIPIVEEIQPKPPTDKTKPIQETTKSEPAPVAQPVVEKKKETPKLEAKQEVQEGYIPPSTTTSNFAQPSRPSRRSCSPRPNCPDIATCDDAYFYLNTCGYSGLDRDKDGVPCETLCGGG